MMMTLTLMTKQNAGEFTVFWKTGLRNAGEVKVDLGEKYLALPEKQKSIAAELYAIHHLLSVKETMGANRSGNGIQIKVSKGAIKKLQKQRSTQHTLFNLTRFLLTRYQEAKISVEKREDWLDDSFETYSIDKVTLSNIEEIINTPNLGPVVITRHAMERFIERLTQGTPKHPWKALTARLCHPLLSQVVLPEKIQAKKVKKYANQAEFWRHESSDMYFVVVPNGRVKTLVTVFTA